MVKQPFDIDFVVTWVNGRDPEWLNKYNKYSMNDTLDVKDARYRDFYIFRYWFRAVQKYAPWVHHVYLVTDHQVPEWLDTENDGITVVDHSQIIPAEYLPVFNSNAIELNLYKINNLSEHFVYFNDDMFLNKPVMPKDFFSEDGRPKDTAGLNAIQPKFDFDYIHVNNMKIINENFDKKLVMKKQFFKFINPINLELNIYTMLLFFWPQFTRFFDLHYPYSFKKSNMEKVINENRNAYRQTMMDRFRGKNDISIWLVRYYSLVNGDFSVRSPRIGKIYDLFTQFDAAIKDINRSKHKLIVINDNAKINREDFRKISQSLKDSFEEKFSSKSSYEKEDTSEKNR